jgi:hypothetical protein
MKKSIQITVEKKVLLNARAKALKKETVISHVIEGFLSLWNDGILLDPDQIRKEAQERVKNQ